MSDAVFIDIETTGLSPTEDEILELAVARVDTRTWEMKENYTGLVYTPGAVRRILERDLIPIVKDMHTQSGLLGELNTLYDRDVSPRSYEEIEQAVLALVKPWGVKGQPIWGSSVHFDRGFLARKFPLLNGYFHYRIVDSSSDMMRLKNTHPELWKKIDEDPTKLPESEYTKHRALDDIRYSIDLERRIAKWITSPAAVCASSNGKAYVD